MQIASVILFVLLLPTTGVNPAVSAARDGERNHGLAGQPPLACSNLKFPPEESAFIAFLPYIGITVNSELISNEKPEPKLRLGQNSRCLSAGNPVADTNRSLTSQQPVIIELVYQKNHPVGIDKLKRVLSANSLDPGELYQWQNHYVVFENLSNASLVKGNIQKAFPGMVVKIYNQPFYDFNRRRCSDTVAAREWDHVILTANLVNNGRLQKEYMDYHATQFEKWPEVSKGFCNAKFQQLLVYRNGRQLMLVISIPKGLSLDELNPKTTENNPRVNEWNALMKKYQVGIEGTKPAETWVFLKKL